MQAHDGATAAPAARLAFHGSEHLTDEELLRLLLPSQKVAALQAACPRLSDITRRGRAGLRGLGLTARQVHLLLAAIEVGRRAQLASDLCGTVVRRAEDVAALFRAEFQHGDQEAMHVFGLDARHRIRCRRLVALGQVDRVQVAIADVFRPLVREGMAASLLVHNHPSGEADPSPQDEQLTRRIAELGQMLGIPLLDHVVVARSGYYSFADHGFLDGLLRSARHRWPAEGAGG